MSESNREISAVAAPDKAVPEGSAPAAAPASPSARSALWGYVAIARPDHWFKNGFMLLGAVFGWLYSPTVVSVWGLGRLALGLLSVCIIASSNYVINEVLDAPSDRHHPTKRHRPVASGRVRVGVAYAEWLLLAVLGLGLASCVDRPFLYSGALLWVMGLIYNVRPIRSKDLPYVDVLTESVNNSLRLALGWFVFMDTELPPLTLLVFFWMIGAFFMATKRFAEYRHIGDPARAAAYRRSFRYYDENRLLISMFFYATAAALFLGMFIVRYHLELVLSIPLIAGFFAYYLVVGLRPNSAAHEPERLYRERGLMLYLVLCLLVFGGLLFVHIPWIYELFNFKPSSLPPLWKVH